jgi:oligosaccharyltransferase complex subunit alpha (ribophorin I)
VTLEISEYFKRRRQPFPRRITIKDNQNLELYDTKYFLSAYEVEKQTALYMLEKHRIVSYDESEGMKVVDEGIKYGPFKNIKPLTFEIVRLSFTYTEPFILLKEAIRSIEISHWGNIALEEYFDLHNVGADLLGEYNRVDAD